MNEIILLQVVYYNSDVFFQSYGHLISIILGINFVLMRTRVKKLKNSIFIQACDSSFTFSPFPDYIKSKEQNYGVETGKKTLQTKPTLN